MSEQQYPERVRHEYGQRERHVILLGDAVVIVEGGAVRINAPKSTTVLAGHEIGATDETALLEIAGHVTGPYFVDGTPGYVRDLADAAQVAEINHRDGNPIVVRDKYGCEVYRSRG